MTDIAAIFHWQLSEMAELSLEELIDWRERAVTVWNRMHGPKDGGT